MAEISIRTERPTQVGPFSWSSGAAESCSATQTLAVGRDENFTVDTAIATPFETNGNDVVFVNLGKGLEIAHPGLFLDVAIARSTRPRGQRSARSRSGAASR